MKNTLKQLLVNEIEQLEQNTLYDSLTAYDKGYLDGEHDHCVCLLNALHIKHHYKYYGTGYDD